MFDIGFSEMMVIAVVALIVIGPERLPKVARTAGLLLGRLQRYVNDVKSDINREMQLEELKKLQAQVQDSARSIESDVRRELQATESALNQAAQGAAESASTLTAPLAEAAAPVVETAGEAMASVTAAAAPAAAAPQAPEKS